MVPSRPALVIVNYQNPADTIRCLESIQASSGDDADIYVVDNGSTPESLDPLQRYARQTKSRIHLIPLAENTGFAGGVNRGIVAAREGGFSHALILNNDTEVAPDFWPVALESARRYPHSVVAGTVLDRTTGAPSFNVGIIRMGTLRVRHLLDFSPEEKLDGIDFVSGCLLLLPLSVVEKVGLLAEQFFMYGEDFEYCLRLKRQGIAIVHEPRLLVWHAVSSGVKRSGLRKEYYLTRNQAYIVWNLGRPMQKVRYGLFLILTLVNKLGSPGILWQRVRGAADALTSRMGRR